MINDMLHFINIHTHKYIANEKAILNNSLHGEHVMAPRCSYGIHPWNITTTNINEALKKLQLLLFNKEPIAAIGEIGIDRTINTSIDLQTEVFIKQAQLAEVHKLPVILHCVKAYSDLLGLRKKYRFTAPWVFHGFTGNLIMAEQAIQQGCYLSFGQALLKNTKLQNTFVDADLAFVFFETDNSTEKIENIYKKAADLRHICIDKLKEQIEINFEKVFNNYELLVGTHPAFTRR